MRGLEGPQELLRSPERRAKVVTPRDERVRLIDGDAANRPILDTRSDPILELPGTKSLRTHVDQLDPVVALAGQLLLNLDLARPTVRLAHRGDKCPHCSANCWVEIQSLVVHQRH